MNGRVRSYFDLVSRQALGPRHAAKFRLVGQATTVGTSRARSQALRQHEGQVDTLGSSYVDAGRNDALRRLVQHDGQLRPQGLAVIAEDEDVER
jgi:hypothetical protein